MTVTASSMAVDYTRLKREFCDFCGYDADNLSTDETNRFNDALRTALNQVIHPPLVPSLGSQQHQWSWLRPVWRAKTASVQRRYTLPVDFERFLGDLQFQAGESQYQSIRQYPVGRLLWLENYQNTTGVPQAFAVESVMSEGTTEQESQLVLHPTPDGEYGIVGQYQIHCRMLSDSCPYPPGGPAHGELYVASILAAAEAKIDDETNGEKKKLFMERLMADIAMDLQRQPSHLGYMGNGSHRGSLTRSSARDLLNMQSGYTTYSGGTDL